MAKKNGRPKSQAVSAAVEMTIKSITPQCPGGERPGFDLDVLLALVEVDALIEEMRLDIHVPPVITDADTAVRRYLVYLSLLIDVMFADILMSVIHLTDIAVRIKRRMLLEYCAKGLYCFDNPDYCLYFTTVAESESVLDKLKKGGQPHVDIDMEKRHLESQRRLFKLPFSKPVRFSQIMRYYTRPADSQTNNEYVGLYGLPSAYVHGDPEGMRYLMPLNEHGHTVPTISVGDDELNAMMVDVGSNTLVFYRVFIATFKPNDELLTNRLSDLELAFNRLSIKHSYGRPDEGMEAVRQEIEEAQAAGRMP